MKREKKNNIVPQKAMTKREEKYIIRQKTSEKNNKRKNTKSCG